MTLTILIASHLATATIGAGAIALGGWPWVTSLRRAIAFKNRQLRAIALLDTPKANDTVKKAVAIAIGMHPTFRVIGKASTPLRPRSAIKAEGRAALAERRAARIAAE